MADTPPTGDSATGRPVRVLDTSMLTRTVQTATEIGRLSGLPSSTAHRIVSERVDADCSSATTSAVSTGRRRPRPRRVGTGLPVPARC
ncbi:hypothetical protein C5C13_07275 [Clavibacter michiganensis]|nr:hypothetical protein C5C13_07275 [Clavibacter michiganensis]